MFKFRKYTEQEAMAAVQQDGFALRYIANPSEEVCMAAVQQSGYALQYMANPSEKVCMAAVRQDGFALQYIANPSEEICMAAVWRNGHALQYIANPSEEVCMAAVQRSPGAIAYVPILSQKILELCTIGTFGREEYEAELLERKKGPIKRRVAANRRLMRLGKRLQARAAWQIRFYEGGWFSASEKNRNKGTRHSGNRYSSDNSADRW